MPTDDPNQTAQRPGSDPTPSSPAPDGADLFAPTVSPTTPVSPSIPDDAPTLARATSLTAECSGPSDKTRLAAGIAGPVADHGLPATQVPEWAEVVDRASRSGNDLRPFARANIPGYEIQKELGRGAMGVVYLARQTALKRTVALKMILSGAHSDPVTQARFEIEAEAVAAVRHPHVVEVHDFGRAGGLPYFSLEFVGGGTLADKLRKEGKFAPRVAAEVVAKLAAGMAAVHARGIIHRDLKPANVLLTEDGEPKVTDFGLARIGQSDMTATNAVMGTPSYMSPEQARGDKGLTTAVDVYGLGAILYELLAGRPPFKGVSAYQTIREVIEQAPEGPRAVNPRADRDLSAVAMKCLAKDPGARYPSATDLLADLERWLAGAPTHARPPGLAGRALRWAQRNTGAAIAIIAAGALWGLATGLFLSLPNRSRLLLPPTMGPFHPLHWVRAAGQNSAAWWCIGGLTLGLPLAIGWVVRAVVRPRTFQAQWPAAGALGLLALLTFLLIFWPFAMDFGKRHRHLIDLHPVDEGWGHVSQKEAEHLSQFLPPALSGPEGDRASREPDPFESALAAVVGAHVISPVESARDRHLRLLRQQAQFTNHLYLSFWCGGWLLVIGLAWFLGVGLHGTWVVDTLARPGQGVLSQALLYLEAGPVMWALGLCMSLVLIGGAHVSQPECLALGVGAVVAGGANIGLVRGWRFRARLGLYLGVLAVGIAGLAAVAVFMSLVLGPSDGLEFFLSAFK